jgi:hypothetical protein
MIKHEAGLGAEAAGGVGAEAGVEVVRMGAGLSGTAAVWRELEAGLEKKGAAG